MFLIREHLDQNKMSNIFLISCILSLMCLLLSPQAQHHLLSSRVRPSLCGFFKGCWCHWGAGVHPWGQSQPTQRVRAQCGGGEPGFRGTWDDDLRDLGCIVKLGNSEEKKKKKGDYSEYHRQHEWLFLKGFTPQDKGNKISTPGNPSGLTKLQQLWATLASLCVLAIWLLWSWTVRFYDQ